MPRQQASLTEMIDHCTEHHFHEINGATPFGGEAVCLTLSNTMDIEALGVEIQPMGWFVTKRTVGTVVIEPIYTSSVPLEAGSELFHVSPTANRDSIVANGLCVGTGGKTRINRIYPQRIYFALDLAAAFEFIDFQCAKPGPNAKSWIKHGLRPYSGRNNPTHQSLL